MPPLEAASEDNVQMLTPETIPAGTNLQQPASPLPQPQMPTPETIPAGTNLQQPASPLPQQDVPEAPAALNLPPPRSGLPPQQPLVRAPEGFQPEEPCST